MHRTTKIIAISVATALVFGATADAARRYVITKSSQIKPGAIAEKNLSASARKALTGRQGPAGPAGAQGAAGPAGAVAKPRRIFYPTRFVTSSTSDEFSMTCPDNAVAIGGGAGTGNGGAVTARTSQPSGVLAGVDATPSGWYLYVVSNSSVFNYTPYIICAG